MLENNREKKDIIKDFQKTDDDTGSSEVQVALLTQRINRLNEHFRAHKQDKGSRRGLMKLVGERRRLLDYVKRHDFDAYKKLLERLSLRK
jgi:small subunit ribosomal protein S15